MSYFQYRIQNILISVAINKFNDEDQSLKLSAQWNITKVSIQLPFNKILTQLYLPVKYSEIFQYIKITERKEL